MKSDKTLDIVSADLEALIIRIGWYANNSQKSLAKKVNEHIPCEYSMPTIWAFDIGKQTYFKSSGWFYNKVLYFFEGTCYKCN